MVHLNLFINEEDTEADKNCFQLISFGLRVSQWTNGRGFENLNFDGHQVTRKGYLGLNPDLEKFLSTLMMDIIMRY